MRDGEGWRGALPLLVAVPVMVVCCGGGTATVAALLAGVAGWMSGFGIAAAAVAAAAAILAVRWLRRGRGQTCSTEKLKQEALHEQF